MACALCSTLVLFGRLSTNKPAVETFHGTRANTLEPACAWPLALLRVLLWGPAGPDEKRRGPVAPVLLVTEFRVPVGTHETYAATCPPTGATKLVAIADLMRPCRDARSNVTPSTGAIGPRLVSWGPPGPKQHRLT